MTWNNGSIEVSCFNYPFFTYIPKGWTIIVVIDLVTICICIFNVFVYIQFVILSNFIKKFDMYRNLCKSGHLRIGNILKVKVTFLSADCIHNLDGCYQKSIWNLPAGLPRPLHRLVSTHLAPRMLCGMKMETHTRPTSAVIWSPSKDQDSGQSLVEAWACLMFTVQGLFLP